MLSSFAFVLPVSAFRLRKGREFEKWRKRRSAKMDGKGVAISSGGGGRDRSTDGLHTEPSGHFKLYSASLRVKDRAEK